MALPSGPAAEGSVCEESVCEGVYKGVCEVEDPGAAPFGNFINYYSFNPPENRLELIPASLLQQLGLNPDPDPVLLLDVGCNSGDLSIALYKHLLQDHLSDRGSPGNVHLLGFDLDQDLISRAQDSNPFPQNIRFIPLDITQQESHAELRAYLQKFGRRRFHLCSCFAVTMWVHLNHGDAAFLALLSGLASLSEYLLLEVQPWKCYRSAARRLRKLGRSDFEHFKTLQIRGDMAAHAKDHLEQRCSMQLAQSFGWTSWDRSVLLFRRR
ncbi:pre-miRNA 5'-monophosphate methyltransferase [Astyanax mexicanus]|uniref:RNA methyltransferase n=1 Tax=Astyanax mexicanus TaxID=7994 RepID=A0A8B9RDN8_ASTMX|nr:pre-miRNA 5'-monophosphate methyltransferase [Astyanax mexicanus]KAG9260163.1 pre-miRNA 5'-monophosphate methyltransferase [Astyanax mexicanus]